MVIANELKATADRISAGEKLLGPAVDGIERAAGQLKNLRKGEQTLQVADLEISIVQALGNIEAGNGHLARLMDSLIGESARFETLVVSAKGAMAELGVKFSTLSQVAARLEEPRPRPESAIRRPGASGGCVCSTNCSCATPWSRNATCIVASPPAIRS